MSPTDVQPMIDRLRHRQSELEEAEATLASARAARDQAIRQLAAAGLGAQAIATVLGERIGRQRAWQIIHNNGGKP